MPALGVAAAVELLPEFKDGLLKLEKHSHFWVMAWLMGRPERDLLQVVPRGVDPDSPDPMHGVFAVRSPARPNPIGLTAAELTRRDGLMLHFDKLDFMDGTPVLDLKPYFASRDTIFSAHNKAIGRPRNREALRESLVFQALRHQPLRHPDAALAIRVMEHYRAEVLHWREPERWSIELPLDRPALADVLVGLTRVTFSAGLVLGPADCVQLGPGGAYKIRPVTGDFDQVLQAEDAVLFAYSAR